MFAENFSTLLYSKSIKAVIYGIVESYDDSLFEYDIQRIRLNWYSLVLTRQNKNEFQLKNNT